MPMAISVRNAFPAPAPTSNVERVRCVVHILLLVLLTPLSVMMAAIWSVLGVFQPSEERVKLHPMKRKTVLITGGKMSKALHFARCVWKAGHRVVMVEVKGCIGARLSRAVDVFEVVADPLDDPAAYLADLLRVARANGVDVFLPVSAAVHAIWDSAAKSALEQMGVRCMHFDPATIALLDDKHRFGMYCAQHGLNAPATYLVTSDEEARELNRRFLAEAGSNSGRAVQKKYVLKNLSYDAMHRLDMFLLPCKPAVLEAYLEKLMSDGTTISKQLPWQLQEFVHGEEYCAMVVLRRSQLRMITVSASSPSQLNYEALLPENSRVAQLIDEWIKLWVKSLPYEIDAQVCFDFIYDQGADCVKILECNPRAHSQSCVFNSAEEQRRLGEVLVDAVPSCEVIRPESERRMYWFTNELFKLALPHGSVFRYRDPKYLSGGLRGFFKRVLIEDWDADFDLSDPLPFIARNHWQIPALLMHSLRQGNAWEKVDFCIGKVVE